jgi:uncharacterized protein (TIGR03083 family)
MGQRSTGIANTFQGAVDDLARTIESCTPDGWAAMTKDEGWTVAQLAQHVSGQFPLEMEFIVACAEGYEMPTYTWDDINAKNGSRADRNAAASKADVLRELRTNAALVATYLRSLSDEQLDRTGPLGLADGAMLTTEQLIHSGVLIEHITGHGESIKQAIGQPVVARV